MKSLKNVSFYDPHFKTLLLILGLLAGVMIGSVHRRQAYAQDIEPATNYRVIVRENVSDPTRSDVYLQDPTTGQEIFYMTLLDIYRNHYHNAEFHNGSLYIIHRTGGDTGYQTNPDWMDSLWRYNPQEPGVKLFSARGLDFRVSADEQVVAVTTFDESLAAYTITFVDRTGGVLNVTDARQFGEYPNISPVKWGDTSFWLSAGGGPTIQQLIKIDKTNFQTTVFDVSMFPISIREFDLNPAREIIAFSDHPVFFDVDSQQIFEQSGATVTLTLYDLNTQTQQQIATATAKPFEPNWLDENTLEYTDPNGADRITQVIP